MDVSRRGLQALVPASFLKVNGSTYLAGQPCATLGIVGCLDLRIRTWWTESFATARGNRRAQECLYGFHERRKHLALALGSLLCSVAFAQTVKSGYLPGIDFSGF